MSKIIVYGNEPISVSSQLFGIKNAKIVHDINEFKKEVTDLIKNSDDSIVFVTSDLFNQLDEETKNIIAISNKPLFIIIPNYKEGKTDYLIRNIVLRALGFDIWGV